MSLLGEFFHSERSTGEIGSGVSSEGPFADPFDLARFPGVNALEPVELAEQAADQDEQDSLSKQTVNDAGAPVALQPDKKGEKTENDTGDDSKDAIASKKEWRVEDTAALLAVAFGTAGFVGAMLAGSSWIRRSLNYIITGDAEGRPTFRHGEHRVESRSVIASGTARVGAINSHVEASGDAVVTAQGGRVRATDRVETTLLSKAEAYVDGETITLMYGKQSSVMAQGRAFVACMVDGNYDPLNVYAHEESTVLMHSGTCVAHDCFVYALGGAVVEGYGKAHVIQADGSTGNLTLSDQAIGKSATSGTVYVRKEAKLEHTGKGSVEASGQAEVVTTGIFVRGEGQARLTCSESEIVKLNEKATASVKKATLVELKGESVLLEGDAIGQLSLENSARATVRSAEAITAGHNTSIDYRGSNSALCNMFLDGNASGKVSSGHVNAHLAHNASLTLNEKAKGSVEVKDNSSLICSGDNSITVTDSGSVTATGNASIKVLPRSNGEVSALKLGPRFGGSLEVNGNTKIELSGKRDIVINDGNVEINCKNFTGRIFVHGGKVSCNGSAEIVASGTTEVIYSGDKGDKCVIYASEDVKLTCHGDKGVIKATGNCKVDAEFESLEVYTEGNVKGSIKVAEGKLICKGRSELKTYGELTAYVRDDAVLTLGEGGTAYQYERSMIRARPGSHVYAEFDSASLKIADGARLTIASRMPIPDMPETNPPVYRPPSTEVKAKPPVVYPPPSTVADANRHLDELLRLFDQANPATPEQHFDSIGDLVKDATGLASLKTLWQRALDEGHEFDFKDTPAIEKWLKHTLENQFKIGLTEKDRTAVIRLTRRLINDQWDELSTDRYFYPDSEGVRKKLADEMAGKGDFDNFQSYLDRYLMKRANKPQYAEELKQLLYGEGERLSDKLGLYVKDKDGRKQYLLDDALELIELDGGGGTFDRTSMKFLLDVSKGEGVSLLAHELAHFEGTLQGLALRKADPQAYEKALIEGVLSNTGNGHRIAWYDEKTGEPKFLWRLNMHGEGLDLMRDMLRSYIGGRSKEKDESFLSEKRIEEFINSWKADPRFEKLMKFAFDKPATLLESFGREVRHYRAVVEHTDTTARFLEQQPKSPAAEERLNRIKQWISERASNYNKARERWGSLENHPRMVEHVQSSSGQLDGIFGQSPEVGGSSWAPEYRTSGAETAAYRFQLIELTRGWMMDMGYSMPEVLRKQVKVIRYFDEISKKLVESRTAGSTQQQESALTSARELAQRMLKDGLPDHLGSRRTALLFLSHNNLIKDTDVPERDFNLMLFGRSVEFAKVRVKIGPFLWGSPFQLGDGGAQLSDGSKPAPDKSTTQQPIEPTKDKPTDRPDADELFDESPLLAKEKRAIDEINGKPLEFEVVEGPNGLKILADRVKGRALAERMEQFNSDKTFREMLEGEIANSNQGSKEREQLQKELENYHRLAPAERALARQKALKVAIDMHEAKMRGESWRGTTIEVIGAAGTLIAVGMLAELILSNCQSNGGAAIAPANAQFK